MLDAVERVTGDAPQWTVLWLHGLGADGNDFAPIVPELVRPGWPALRFLFPHAPVRPVTINGGMPMRAWYDLRDLDLANRADAEGVRESVAQVDALIAREGERGIVPERIILGGFSQGGAVVLHTAYVKWQETLGGVMALSTYAPTFTDSTVLSASQQRIPALCLHGVYDPVVIPSMGRAAFEYLNSWGVTVQWKEYPMEHAVLPEEIQDIGAWLIERLR